MAPDHPPHSLGLLPGRRPWRVPGTTLRRAFVAGGVGASGRLTVHLVDRQPAGSPIPTGVRLEELIAGAAHESGVAGHHFRYVNRAIELAELRHRGGVHVGGRMHAHPVHKRVCEGLLHHSHLLCKRGTQRSPPLSIYGIARLGYEAHDCAHILAQQYTPKTVYKYVRVIDLTHMREG